MRTIFSTLHDSLRRGLRVLAHASVLGLGSCSDSIEAPQAVAELSFTAEAGAPARGEPLRITASELYPDSVELAFRVGSVDSTWSLNFLARVDLSALQADRPLAILLQHPLRATSFADLFYSETPASAAESVAGAVVFNQLLPQTRGAIHGDNPNSMGALTGDSEFLCFAADGSGTARAVGCLESAHCSDVYERLLTISAPQ